MADRAKDDPQTPRDRPHNVELGEWQFPAGPDDDVVTLVPSDVIASIPAARRAAEQDAGRLQFDFLDDKAVLTMLRLRNQDEQDMFSVGARRGILPAAGVVGLFVYWALYVSYWETSRSRYTYMVAAAFAAIAMFVPLLLGALSILRDPSRQSLRARAAAYRRITRIARDGGADVPRSYPHYGRYTFAARFHPDAEEFAASVGDRPA